MGSQGKGNAAGNLGGLGRSITERSDTPRRVRATPLLEGTQAAKAEIPSGEGCPAGRGVLVAWHSGFGAPMGNAQSNDKEEKLLSTSRSRMHDLAAVDVEGLSGDVLRVFGGEKGGHRRILGRFLPAPER